MSDERTELPWSRFVAIGDSFTEGVGDPEADSPGGLRGWADRFAEVLAEHNSDLAYANLAVRGKLSIVLFAFASPVKASFSNGMDP